MLASFDHTISLIAPAKINLALHVTGRRDDGYHLLDSLVVFARFGDRLDVTKAAVDSFTISGPYGADLPGDESNLVLKARDALRHNYPDKATPVAIHLEKYLPIASGIGGGSSDAAAALRALTALWDVEATLIELAALGLPLGADVPMCLHGEALIARGIGEDIERIAAFPRLPMVLVNNGVTVSTPQVFSALSRRDNPPLPALPLRMGPGDVCTYLAQTDNHLFAATQKLAPSINASMQALRETNPLLARMSGSGGTCFAIYADDEMAEAAATRLHQNQPDWFVVATSTEGN
ncbi:4-(cytidine 5'-diphospho)-2-C-methyl-D-erythritol kinase [Phyllobacterium sp. OV277]|uniref:4-(cytidine 5'-diphospho)-2-C-methyl-D-erythritol kinase n=1 Tax=Phyllobacterium sp. OV277 TaxID=1882772 RepID=UPI000B85E4A3|nr:4-(cytidine 5'-diphospho)-2-C-methyl-D-erythritol kinase [Phyllobacterium sp. OV277]